MLIVVAAFAGATWFAYDAYVKQQNRRLMMELAAQTLQRAELAADYAVITLGDAVAAGLGQCDPNSLIEIRRTVYRRGAVKDIQVIGADGQVRCAGVPQARELSFAEFNLTTDYPARNGNIFFDDIAGDSSGMLGISWRFNQDLTLLAVLNVDSLLFEVFPMQLRDFGTAELMLGDDTAAALFQPENAEAIGTTQAFNASSQRYPLKVYLNVDEAALAGWNRDADPYVLVFCGLMGLIVGVLAANLLVRPIDPVREMELALRDGEFVPYFQPIFSVTDRSITGCEVLMRWQKQDGTIVPPDHFVPLAEQSGIIRAMTRAILKRALNELSELLRAHTHLKIAFNITPDDLVSVEFAKEVCDIAATAGVARGQIVLEVTERQQLAATDETVAAIAHLRELGFRISLDDTGTGHNGLSSVQTLGVDILKIDKHFIDLIGQDTAADTIVEMLVRLAGELGMTTVAEGIETEAQLNALKAADVDEGQGYLVSKPLPTDAFLNFVGAQNSGAPEAAAA